MSKDVLKDFSDMQQLKDKLLIEIGQLYANNYRAVNENAIPGITEKVLVLKQIEEKLNDLEDEVVIMGTA